MRRRAATRFAATGAAALAAAFAGSPALACTLVLTEHRSERELLRAPLLERGLSIAFTHSVLGTPVLDRYALRGDTWHLVEERFEGAGYGLPQEAGPGEALLRDGAAWRLLTDRPVQPLVVRPLPAQRMRLVLADGRGWLLGELSTQAVHVRTEGC